MKYIHKLNSHWYNVLIYITQVKPNNEVSAQIKMSCAEYAMKAANDQGSKQMYEACIELYENK